MQKEYRFCSWWLSSWRFHHPHSLISLWFQRLCFLEQNASTAFLRSGGELNWRFDGAAPAADAQAVQDQPRCRPVVYLRPRCVTVAGWYNCTPCRPTPLSSLWIASLILTFVCGLHFIAFHTIWGTAPKYRELHIHLSPAVTMTHPFLTSPLLPVLLDLRNK
jgi:hypothetical protein